MSRIRTIKPEFWQDVTVGSLSREARLLLLATLNVADDEGLLRWNASLLRATAFIYDDDIKDRDVAKSMDDLVEAGFVLPYSGGRNGEKFAWIVKFHSHQALNRPQASKHPAPPITDPEVFKAYAQRDRFTCARCGDGVSVDTQDAGEETPVLANIEDGRVSREMYPRTTRIMHARCQGTATTDTARRGARRNDDGFAVEGRPRGEVINL